MKYRGPFVPISPDVLEDAWPFMMATIINLGGTVPDRGDLTPGQYHNALREAMSQAMSQAIAAIVGETR